MKRAQFIQGYSGVTGSHFPLPHPRADCRGDRDGCSLLSVCHCVPAHRCSDLHRRAHVPMCTHTALPFIIHWSHHTLIRDCLHFQNFDGAKSQLVTKGKQSGCLKELSSCHYRRRGMKSKHLRGLACFHGK